MRLSLIERMISFVSPKTAVKRHAAREVINLLDTMETERGYDAARVGRRTEGWLAPGTSANAEIGPAVARTRNRCRDLGRNNPHGARSVRILKSDIVGTGIRPRLSPEDRQSSEWALDAFNEWAAACDPEARGNWFTLQDLAVRAVAESGEALIVWDRRPRSAGLAVPLQCRVLESDYLDHTKSGIGENGNRIIQGVEFDGDHRRVGYWLFDEHPGEMLIGIPRGITSRRVSATMVDHVFDRLRPGQVRGVPWLAPAAMRLRDLDDYNDAELVRKKIEACLAVFVTTSSTSETTLAKNVTTETGGKKRRIENFQPGMAYYMEPGEEVSFSAPAASEDLTEFVKLQLHAIAVGVGVTYEDLSGDFSGFNFTSMRGSRLGYYRVVDQWQSLMVIPQLCEPAWRRVGAEVMGRRRRNSPWPAALWGRPARPWIDPREIRARIDMIRAGLTSLQAEISQTGRDPVEVLREIQDLNTILDEMGLILDSDPRKSGRTGAAGQGDQSTNGADDDDDTEETEDDSETPERAGRPARQSSRLNGGA